MRLANYDRAATEGRAGPGGAAWTPEIVEMLVKASRDSVGWPMRPAAGALPPGPTIAAQPSEVPQSIQEWRWLEIAVPWLDDEVKRTTLPWGVLVASDGEQTVALLSAFAPP